MANPELDNYITPREIPIKRIVIRIREGERWVRLYDVPVDAIQGRGDIICIDALSLEKCITIKEQHEFSS